MSETNKPIFTTSLVDIEGLGKFWEKTKEYIGEQVTEINSTIEDNEKVVASALTDLDSRVTTNTDAISSIQDELNSLSGGAGSIATQIDNAIEKLNLPTTYLKITDEKVKSVDTTSDSGIALTHGSDGKLGISVETGTVVDGDTSVVTGGAVYTAVEGVKAAGVVTMTETAGTAENGLLKTYTFTQNGTTIGTINLAKDLVVTSGEVKMCTLEGVDVKCLELVLSSGDIVHIPVTDLVDVYTAGDYITIGDDNKISVNKETLLEDITIRKGTGTGSALQTVKGETFTDKNKYSSTNLQEVPADASGNYSVALGGTAAATGAQSVANGHRCIARGETSHAEGHCAVVDYFDEIKNGYGSHAEGYGTYVIGTYSHAEGSETAVAGSNSHAEGGSTIIESDFAHAEGYGSFVGDRNNAPKFEIPEGGEGEGDSGNVTPGPDVTGKKGVAAHAEGNYTIAEGNYSHAEGRQAKTFGEASHAEGNETITEGNYSHAEGWMSTANGAYSHAEGQYTRTHADAAHSEGNNTDAYAPFSHAEGIGTRTNADVIGQHAEGYFNAESDGLLVVGCGTSDDDRKNALDVKQDGRVFIKGVGNYDGTSDEAIDLAGVIDNIYDKSETYNKTEIDNALTVKGTNVLYEAKSYAKSYTDELGKIVKGVYEAGQLTSEGHEQRLTALENISIATDDQILAIFA